MAKNKKRKNVNRNEETKMFIQEINYDKLAESIVCATEKLEE